MKKKLKKAMLSATILITLILCNMVNLEDSVAVVNAANNAEIIVQCSNTAVGIGDRITVTVKLSLTGNAELDSLSYGLGFTSGSLKLLSTTLGSTYKNASLNQTSTSISWSCTSMTNSKSATLFTATFEVLKTNPEPQLYCVQQVGAGDIDNIILNPAFGQSLYLTCAHKNTSDYIVEYEATCLSYGLAKKKCNDCSEIIDEKALSPLGHTPGEEVIASMPTCETDGEACVWCARCSEPLDSRVIPATGHNFGEWVVLKEATAESEGEEERICSVCNEKETRIIPKLEFDTEEPSTKETTTEELTTEEPSTEAPTTEEPGTEAPTTEESSTKETTTEKNTTVEKPIATPTDVKNITSPKTGDGAVPTEAAVLMILSVACLVVIKIKMER